MNQKVHSVTHASYTWHRRSDQTRSLPADRQPGSGARRSAGQEATHGFSPRDEMHNIMTVPHPTRSGRTANLPKVKAAVAHCPAWLEPPPALDLPQLPLDASGGSRALLGGGRSPIQKESKAYLLLSERGFWIRTCGNVIEEGLSQQPYPLRPGRIKAGRAD